MPSIFEVVRLIDEV